MTPPAPTPGAPTPAAPTPQRWLVLGAAGMLGQDVVAAARLAGHTVTAAARGDVDVTDLAALAAAVPGHDVIVNCAAYTAVDAAEDDEAAAFALNAVAAAHVARATDAAGARLVHVSTDYVFDGRASSPYPADHPISPASAYGRTKAAGEWAVRANAPAAWIVRTAWLYGAGGPNFAATMKRLAGQRDTVSVVTDQVGAPTWSADVADGIVRIAAADAPFGIWHATSSGSCTWFDFARAVFVELGLEPERVMPTTSAEFAAPAPRPAYSVLSHDMWDAAGLEPLRDWRDALAAAAPTVLHS